MKKIFTLLILTITTFQLFSQLAKKAPLNEDFKEFINQKTKPTGFIPSPTIYVFSDKINDEIAKFVFPESYDLRDENYVTSVKNQGNAGHCWSFAALGAIESRSLVLGFNENDLDLSEKNMATCHGFVWEQGGNQSIATAYLSRLQGPILETQDPYADDNFNCTDSGTTPQFYVTESNFLPRNAEVVKYMLMHYGAIAVSYRHESSYFNSTNNTYYYSGSEGPNHGVLLVGWDDTKGTAGGTGAWIIKNSWDTDWGEDGYFYMSYNDTHALRNATIYPTRQEINEVDTLLIYDYFGEVTSYGFGDSKDYALVKYNVSEEHSFNKIGTYIGASNSYISIEAFKTKTGDLLTDTLAKAYDLFVEHPGYHTFNVPFTTSGDIYIKISYYSPNDKFPIPVEFEIEDYVYPDIESNVGWISNHGDEWVPVGSDTEYPFDLCIRAYGTKKDIKAGFTTDYTTTCINSDVVFTDQSAGNVENYSWDFGKDATPATADTQGPHTVTYASEGFKTIKLIVENATGMKDSVISYNYLNVSSEINVQISPYESYKLAKGDSVELIAHGADTYHWYPEELIEGNINDAKVKVSPATDTTIYVLGTLGSCNNTDSIRIIITQAPENDDVCNAIDLDLNEELGPFTNANATVQENEPHPPLGGCNLSGNWCEGEGLENSVWFTFTAPNSGRVKIETSGFDNQIAVWDALDCEDITSGNDTLYTLLAANDDHDAPDYSATIDEVADLEPGKLYWLQMDGSAGGEEGECTIKITETWPVSIDKVKNPDFNIYPNPNTGQFKVDLNNLHNLNENIKIQIINTDGTLLKQIDGVDNKKEYDLSIERKGLFMIRIISRENHFTLPVIVN